MTRAEFGQRLKDRRMALGCSVTLLAKRSQTARETIYRIEAGNKVRRAVIDRVVAAIKDPGMPAACAEMKRRQLSGITGERHVFTKEQSSLGAKRGGKATSANKAHMRANRSIHEARRALLLCDLRCAVRDERKLG